MNLVFKTMHSSAADSVYFEHVQRQRTAALLAMKFNKDVLAARCGKAPQSASMIPASPDLQSTDPLIYVIATCVVTLPERQNLCGVLEPFLPGDWHDDWHDADKTCHHRYAMSDSCWLTDCVLCPAWKMVCVLTTPTTPTNQQQQQQQQGYRPSDKLLAIGHCPPAHRSG